MKKNKKERTNRTFHVKAIYRFKKYSLLIDFQVSQFTYEIFTKGIAKIIEFVVIFQYQFY